MDRASGGWCNICISADAGADTWNEVFGIPFTPVKVNHTYYITQNGNDTTTHSSRHIFRSDAVKSSALCAVVPSTFSGSLARAQLGNTQWGRPPVHMRWSIQAVAMNSAFLLLSSVVEAIAIATARYVPQVLHALGERRQRDAGRGSILDAAPARPVPFCVQPRAPLLCAGTRCTR